MISTKSRYGVQAVVDVARNGLSHPVSIRAIADRQRLPEAYLEQLVGPLRKAGILRSVRGNQGGYVMARAAERVTALDIVTALEGPLHIASCACGGRDPDCLEHSLWRRLETAMAGALAEVTVADLVHQSVPQPAYRI
jgi:Rrf2 family protein